MNDHVLFAVMAICWALLLPCSVALFMDKPWALTAMATLSVTLIVSSYLLLAHGADAA